MESPFATATSLEDYRRLFTEGFDPNQASGGDGKTAVFHLWHEGFGKEHYADALQLLLEHGADLDHLDMSGFSALDRSASDALSLLLIKAGASVAHHVSDNFDTSSIVVSSATKGHIRTLRHLVEKKGIDVDMYLGRGTAMHHMLYDHLLQDEAFFSRGLVAMAAYSNGINLRDFVGKTPLALVYENASCVRTLLDSGADVDAKIPMGWWFHRSVFDSYVVSKREVEFTDDRMWEKVIHSVHCRSSDVIQALLEGGAGIDCVDSEGNTPLLRLISHGSLTRHDLDVFNILFEYGASCTIRNREGNTIIADMPLARHPLLSSRIESQVAEENWSRRRWFFLVMRRCHQGGGGGGDLGGCAGLFSMLANSGYGSSQGFARAVVEYI